MSISQTRFQPDDDVRISRRVLSAIADQENIDLYNLEPPLYDVIDTDALDALFQSPGSSGHVKFTYLGYEITVTNEGQVSLAPVDE